VNDLQETLEQIRRKIGRYGKSSINEQNTKSTLIQPLLRALGWDVEDCDEVHLEYKQKGKDLIKTPTTLFRKYKGKVLEALLNADGSVTFDGRNYTACSAAAAAARGSVIGGAPATNGWTFWQFRNADNQKQTLDDLRQRFSSDTTK
jgi:hypothetical protein